MLLSFPLSKVSDATLSSESMAAETRHQTLAREVEDLGAKFDQLMTRTQTLEETITAQGTKLDENVGEMFEAIRLLTTCRDSANQTSTSHSSTPTTSHHPINSSDSGRGRIDDNHPYSGLTRLAKLDFPSFNGHKVKDWLFKAEQFFVIDRTPNDLKVCIASIHFDDLAATWHQSLIQSDVSNTLTRDWSTYAKLLHDRFSDLMDDPVAELKLLHETNGIVEYHARFDLIKTRISLTGVTFTEEYLVSNYLAGLCLETQMHVRMFEPRSINQCLMLGRLYETAHPPKPSAWSNSKSTYGSKGILPFRKNDAPRGSRFVQNEKPKEQYVTPPGMTQLSAEEIAWRRSEGLCFTN